MNNTLKIMKREIIIHIDLCFFLFIFIERHFIVTYFYFFIFFFLATNLFKLLAKYKPETPQAKRDRLRAAAKTQEKGEAAKPTAKPKTIKFGLNHVTRLVEQKKARLVIIAADVDPIEVKF